jgi:hypothetical protein
MEWFKPKDEWVNAASDQVNVYTGYPAGAVRE